MLDAVPIALDEIYVPAKRRRTRDDDKVDSLALDILENGLKNPIHVRRDEARYVLLEGLHRLEAVRALGEETVDALVVSAKRR
ncbi:MAG: ParB N-terminal domain-containing protein [Defluviicoccus sp.]|nr:ParB N-terminal domain-containing protein [Defluviicoccus sp.]